MNDRQRLEAIVSVVCKYLPPDGISKDQAMTEIISLVDPLPEQEQGEPDDLTIAYMSGLHRGKDLAQQRTWVGLTDDDKCYLNEVLNLQGRFPVIDAIEAKLREKNSL